MCLETSVSMPQPFPAEVVLTCCFRDNTLLGKNGWMHTPGSGDLLFWVPPQARTGLWRPSTVAVLGVPSTQVDFTAFVPWDQWNSLGVDQLSHDLDK